MMSTGVALLFLLLTLNHSVQDLAHNPSIFIHLFFYLFILYLHLPRHRKRPVHNKISITIRILV